MTATEILRAMVCENGCAGQRRARLTRLLLLSAVAVSLFLSRTSSAQDALASATTSSENSSGAAPLPTIANGDPQITSFSATNPLGNYWTFSGTVADEDPAGCLVNFGELLEGVSVDVNADGTFSYTTYLEEEGRVTAQAIDAEGALSSTVEAAVIQ